MPQDFSGHNLRGRSFKGQNLEGVNFSGADIRSADFTGANLRNANFSHATAGLQKRWAVFLVGVSWLLSAIAGLIAALPGILIATFFVISENINPYYAIIPGFAALITIASLFFTIIREGLGAVTVVVTVMLAVLGAFTWIFLIIGLNKEVAYIGALTVAVAGALSAVVIGFVLFATTIAATTAISGKASILATVIAAPITSVLLTVVSQMLMLQQAVLLAKVIAVVVAVVVALAATYLAKYLAWCILTDDLKNTFFHNLVIAFSAIGGVSFRNANLTDANFTAATLKSTDFRKAILTRTCFKNTKKLDHVRPGTTYLQNTQLRQLLITGQGQEKNFDRDDLRGVNFQGANLVDISFIGTDLSKANLKDADLSRAKLVQAQLNGTDLTGATLTGAYIQDWGITTDTKFDGVRCEYVYMRLPTNENPDPLRKPDNHKEVFADGEFGDFIQPIFDTLDLYHNQDVDPRAIAISFKQLAEKHPDAELEIVAMEKRGQDKFLLRAKTASTADKSELSAEYFETYNEIQSLPEREIKLLLAEKDSRIQSLETMVMTALQSPKFYAENYNNQGDTKMAGERNINTGGGNYNERIQGDYVQGNYYAAGQPQSLAEAAAEIQQLLKQLEQTYPTATTSQQMVVAAEAINRIESNPTLKKRAINAAKEGGLAALEKAIDNPAGAFIVGAIKGWQEVEAED